MASTGYVIEIALRVKMNFELLLKRHSTLGLISHTLLGRSGVCLCCRLGRQCRPRRIYLRPLAPPIPNACLYSQCIGCCMTWRSHVRASGFPSCRPDLFSPEPWQIQAQGELGLGPSACPALCPALLACHAFAGPSSSVVCFPDELCCLWEGALVCPVHASCGPLVWAWLLCIAAFGSGSSVLHLSLPLWVWSHCSSQEKPSEQVLIYTHLSLTETSAVPEP